MRELVKQLEQTALPNSCPHGRPTKKQVTLQQIGKRVRTELARPSLR
jgi:DNA mismatch repair ATPase MutL